MEKGLVDQLDITIVHEEFEADVFFPEIDTAVWKEVSREEHHDEKSGLDYAFVSFVRK